MKDALIVHLLAFLPRRRISRGMGFFARIRLPALCNQLILRLYAWWYGVNTEEMEGDFSDYKCLDDFFTRELVSGARPVADDPNGLVSPVDGKVLLVERVGDAGVELPGGRFCDIRRLLGPIEMAGELDVAIIYLAPPDYHRVHHCCDGQVLRASYEPGRLWPVFPGAVRKVAGLFENNERLITSGVSQQGTAWASIMVGAFGVGRISTSYWDLVTNSGGFEPCVFEPPSPVAIARGDELGRFHLGSTVVLVFERGSVHWQIGHGQRLRMGELIGVWTEN